MIAERIFAAIDFESAGAERGKTDVPVQIGMATWSQAHGHSDAYVSFLHTKQKISWAAQKVHGITTDDLAGAPPLMTLWPEVKKRLGGNIAVAHGHGTEKRYLRAFPAHGFSPWIDTLQLYRAVFPDLASHALGNLCEQFQLTDKVSSLVPHKTWHDALYDSVASLVLLEKLIQDLNLGEQPVEILTNPDTRDWHRAKRSK
ncbi:MAG: 3'-5' exonuclease [Akkermansiaceae bacterium]|nr:3'-5' exonuclease [Akkermansiaceae bacterium]